MRLAQVADGVVVNLIEVAAGAVPNWAATWPVAASDVNIGHSWDGSSFVPPGPDIDAAAADVRRMRAALLATVVDPYASNVLRWASLHPLKQEELTAYRAALLDITNQAGFPLNVQWPVPPVI